MTRDELREYVWAEVQDEYESWDARTDAIMKLMDQYVASERLDAYSIGYDDGFDN